VELLKKIILRKEQFFTKEMLNCPLKRGLQINLKDIKDLLLIVF